MKHTPANWGHSGSDVNEAAQLRRTIVSLSARDKEIVERERQLLATQADLLAALRECVERFGAPETLRLTGWGGTIEAARAAIARAESSS